MLFFRRRRPTERLATSFRWLDQKPFPEEQAEHHAAFYTRGAYQLTIAKESYFVWETLEEERRLGDFTVEAEVELDPSNGHSAIGMLFRQVNDENFYMFLLSTRGNYRVDLLFNNHPRALVEWTSLPERGGGAVPGESFRRSLRIVAHGARFSFHVDEEWVGELEDDVLPEGGIGFAAQNFAGAGPGTFRLRRFHLDARPMAVEKEYLRGWYYAPVSPASRLRFAETLFSMGSYDAAAVQMRRSLKDRDGAIRERFLLAECYARLSLRAEALAEVERVLARDPAHHEAALEKANLLYLENRLLETRDFIAAGIAQGTILSVPVAWNLLGNAEYGLGNWDIAAAAYARAIELQPDMPLFLQNAARAAERSGKGLEAAELYLRAARLLFAEEAFDELSMVVPRARALQPESREALAMEAKMLYREGKADEAFELLRRLAKEGSEDSAVHFLLGIMLNGKERRAEALRSYQRACDLEPDYPLYQFRLAEALHLAGQDPHAPLDRALALSPSDPWANNLAGELKMEEGDIAGAILCLQKAYAAAPGEQDIAVNLSDALSRGGRHEEALAAVEAFAAASGDSAVCANQRGNIRARQGSGLEAVREYESALRMDPDNFVYKQNCAAACIETDMVHRAEELLAQIEPDHPTASVYNLLGQVAALKGERARAELSYTMALERDPGNPDITVNLAILQRERGHNDAARDLLLALLARSPGHPRATGLLQRIRDEKEHRLSCAVCGREWWVPRELSAQPALRVRGEPPADAPAGRCPRCGKLYCVGCASAYVRELRFYCPDCGETLKLSEDALKWLLARALEKPIGNGGALPARDAP